MTDINGVKIIDTTATETVDPRAKNAIVITEVRIELAPGRNIFELKLREPGIIRALGFWVHEPKVVASAMRGVQKLLMPLLFVECDPNALMSAQNRVFALIPSEAMFTPQPGWTAKHVTTAIAPDGARHLFELVEVS